MAENFVIKTCLRKSLCPAAAALVLVLAGIIVTGGPGREACAREHGPDYEKGFSEGYVLAIVQLNEDVIMNTYGMLDLLLSGQSHSKTLESQMVLWGINTPLVDIAKQAASMGQTGWPEPFREHARITSVYLRKFMRILSEARNRHGWRHEDPAMEARIQRILSVYRKYGNAFAIAVGKKKPAPGAK